MVACPSPEILCTLCSICSMSTAMDADSRAAGVWGPWVSLCEHNEGLPYSPCLACGLVRMFFKWCHHPLCCVFLLDGHWPCARFFCPLTGFVFSPAGFLATLLSRLAWRRCQFSYQQLNHATGCTGLHGTSRTQQAMSDPTNEDNNITFIKHIGWC